MYIVVLLLVQVWLNIYKKQVSESYVQTNQPWDFVIIQFVIYILLIPITINFRNYATVVKNDVIICNIAMNIMYFYVCFVFLYIYMPSKHQEVNTYFTIITFPDIVFSINYQSFILYKTNLDLCWFIMFSCEVFQLSKIKNLSNYILYFSN